jgi:uncharacterized protein DUF3147
VTPRFAPEELKKTRPWEYVVRFLFGGVVTACTGFVAHHFGAEVGGLFLAFPAILPASLTLVMQHDGRRQAADDVRGAMLGSLGLAAFALVTWRTGAQLPGVVVLAVATVTWVVVSVAMWAIRYGRRTSVAGRRQRYRVA